MKLVWCALFLRRDGLDPRREVCNELAGWLGLCDWRSRCSEDLERKVGEGALEANVDERNEMLGRRRAGIVRDIGRCDCVAEKVGKGVRRLKPEEKC